MASPAVIAPSRQPPSLTMPDRLYRTDSFNLKSVKSHAQLTQTANNVRIISQNLSNATIKLNIKTIMIVTKPGDSHLIALTNTLLDWLLSNYGFLTVYVDKLLKKHVSISKSSNEDSKTSEHITGTGASSEHHSKAASKKLSKQQKLDRIKYWSSENFEEQDSYSDMFDLIVTLGGDGTVLYVSQLFQHIVPPTVAFSLGSLGFLTNFKFKNYKKILTKILRLKYVKTNLRLRLSCLIVEARTDKVVMSKNILNEVTIDRGPNPFLTNLALYGNDLLITITQADGLCIATPTGSTAYSLAAGGSLVHPSVSAISVTPICPHTLSFRPIILPDSMELKVTIPAESRCQTSWVSFDGKSRFELNKKYYAVIRASKYYFPTVMNGNNEYFDSVSNNLNWNTRKLQKPLKFHENYKADIGESDEESAIYHDEPTDRKKKSPKEIGTVNGVSHKYYESDSDDDQKDTEDGHDDGDETFDTDEYACTDSDQESFGFGTQSFYDQNESQSDEDFIETPVIPFQHINEALEVFSDEEIHDGNSHIPNAKSRSTSSGNSKKIRTNSFTNFNQIYRDKLRLDNKKLNNKFSNLKINNGNTSTFALGDLKSSNSHGAKGKHDHTSDNKHYYNTHVSQNNSGPHLKRLSTTAGNNKDKFLEKPFAPGEIPLHSEPKATLPKQLFEGFKNPDKENKSCSQAVFELKSPTSNSSSDSL